MALSSELTLRLESGEPLPKRLKLAKNAYCSTDLAINRKEDTILEWLCSVTSTDPAAWETLSSCIDWQNLNSRTLLSHKTKIKLIDTLTDKLKSDNGDSLSDVVFDCCNWVLSSSEMHHFFQTKINRLGTFVRDLLVRLKSDDITSIKTSSGHKCALNAIESLVRIHKLHIDKEKLSITFLKHVLIPLCALIDPNCKDNSNRIGAEAHKCMQQLLFGKGRSAEYKEYFETKSETLLPAKLFTTVAEESTKIAPDQACNMIKYLFRAAVGSYKTDSSLVDNIFREFINSDEKLRIVVANSLVEDLADVHLDYGTKVNDITLSQFLASLIDQVLIKEDYTEADYCLIRNITSLNPLVIEDKVQSIFKRVILTRRETESERSQYTELLVAILEASARLRREQKFIPWLLLALHEALVDNKNCDLRVDQILPPEFDSKFINFVSQLNSSQTVAALKSLTFHLKSHCVEEYEQRTKNQVYLMAASTVSLLVSFCKGIQIFEHTLPLIAQQKFIAAFAQLGDVLTDLSGKILKAEHDAELTAVLFSAALLWSHVQHTFDFYSPEAGAKNITFPISDKDLERHVQRAKESGNMPCKDAVNCLLFHRISMKIDHHQRLQELTGVIGELEDWWSIIINSYAELVPLLSSDQLSNLASLVLEDVIANGIQKWRPILELEHFEENEKFVVAIVCHALKKIGSILSGSTAAAITDRINLIKILEDTTDTAAVPALSRKKLIRDVESRSTLSKSNVSRIERCLETLRAVPLSFLSVPLRTMSFVVIYVVGRECGRNEGIKDLCDKILLESLEDGGVNVFDFIDPASLIPRLPGSKVLQKAFKISLRNMDPAKSLEHIASLSDCPTEAIPTVLSCIDNLKSKLNVEQKRALCKVEKTLGKKVLGNINESLEFPQKIHILTLSLKIAIDNDEVTTDLSSSISAMLRSTAMDANNDQGDKNSTDEKSPSDVNSELIRERLELGLAALKYQARLDLSEKLVSDIWTMVLKYPETKDLTPRLDASPVKVFSTVLTLLHNQTEMQLQQNDIVKLNNTLSIWNSIFNSDMGTARNEFRLNATYKLLRSLQTVDVVPGHWPSLVKLLSLIVSRKHMQLSAIYIDMIITAATRSLREENFSTYEEALALCLALVRSRVEIMTDRLPLLLELYRLAISGITRMARNSDAADSRDLAICSSNIEKVTNALVQLKKDIRRVCPYMVAELVNDFTENDLQPAIKESFSNCINSLLSITDSYGVNMLLRALPTAKREIFKGLNETYNKFHRFTGKI